jgi:hypothetical protein
VHESPYLEPEKLYSGFRYLRNFVSSSLKVDQNESDALVTSLLLEFLAERQAKSHCRTQDRWNLKRQQI